VLFKERQHHFVKLYSNENFCNCKVGLLGCRYAVERGAYRIAQIYRAPNWHPELRAPLAEPGVGVKEGDFLLAVDGRPLPGAVNVFEAFEMTAGRQVTLTVSDEPALTLGGAGQREVTVTALSGGEEQLIRQWSWAEERRQRVDELSGGRLGYVYMPNTGVDGYTAFNRGFFSQLGALACPYSAFTSPSQRLTAGKKGLVVDERTNGGGIT
jgi:tricorn protease